jgi:putative transposase
VDFVRRWPEKTEIGAGRFIVWLDITASKFYDWRERYGKVNEHNGCVPRDFWLEDWEKQAIIGFHMKKPSGRLPAADVHDAGCRRRGGQPVQRVASAQPGRTLVEVEGKPSKKGTGFAQPLAAHQHGHIDVSYLNIGGTFYYLCSILDGFSRYVVNWDIRESMTEAAIEIILQGAKEKCPDARPRIISDNGPQFIAKDFKEFIRLSGMTHVRTSPFYPQSNGKIERWHQSLKGECIRPGTPLSLDDARRLVSGYVDHYNNVRLNSATGYITPKDMLAGRQQEIHAERDRKLDAARKQRQIRRQHAA